jgi:hypothetical protein
MQLRKASFPDDLIISQQGLYPSLTGKQAKGEIIQKASLAGKE